MLSGMVSIGASQKGSRERCLPVFLCENETEENRKNGRKQGKQERKKTEKKRGKNTDNKKRRNGEKKKKTEKKKKRKKIGSDTAPATPFAKSRLKANKLNFAALKKESGELER